MQARKLLTVLCLAPALAAAGSDIVRKPSAHGVTETIDRLEALVREKGLTRFARVDHRGNAEGVGLSLPDSQVLIFGNPKVGTQVMQCDPGAGLDLPLRVLAYADAEGKTWVAYHNPQGLKQDHGLDDCPVVDKVEAALDALTDQAID
jgi:uncharacterized protein (DUF302 family)